MPERRSRKLSAPLSSSFPSPLEAEGRARRIALARCRAREGERCSNKVTPLSAHFVRRPLPLGGVRRKWVAVRLFFVMANVSELLCAPRTAARGDNAPSKTITVIAPASPGGVTDLLARMLARRFIADWGAQAIVENKPGANNQVAAEYVARQPG